MTNSLSTRGLRWLTHRPRIRAAHGVWIRACFAFGLLAAGGCRDSEALRVQLRTRAPTNHELLQLQVDALVSGPQEGLTFKWFAVSGVCTPQVTELPGTTFRFAGGVSRDRITVEVWRGGKQVARSEVDVSFEGELAQRLEAESATGLVSVEITLVPPREAGGDHTRADIAGKVSGVIDAAYRVIVYARAYENWYIQPTVRAMHPIKEDLTWSTWTHTGDSYAALVVHSAYVPMARLDLLPSVGGSVKAKTVVEGKQP